MLFRSCTIFVTYEEAGAENRLVYERPQRQIPHRPLSLIERMQVAQFPNDEVLTAEAKAIFSDMQVKGRISMSAVLSSVFIARTSEAAREMTL